MSPPPKWLNEEKLVQRLIELIHTGKDEEVSLWSRLENGPLHPFSERLVSFFPPRDNQTHRKHFVT